MENKLQKTEALRFGTMFHTFVLEPELFEKKYVLADKIDRRTKEGKALFEEIAQSGKQIITTEEYDTVVFETVERNLSRLISDAPVLSTSDLGVPEDQKEILPELAQGVSRYTGTILMEPSDSEFDYTYVSGTLDPAETDDGTKPYLLMKNAETGDSEFHALFRTTTHDDDGRSNRYGVAAYIRSDIIESGEYDLFIAYETDGSWNVSGKLGEYIKEDF
jgi:hypothetical protein